MTIVEARFLGCISDGFAITPRRNPEKELRVFATARNRLNKVESSEVARPCRRFRTTDAAMAVFTKVRDRD